MSVLPVVRVCACAVSAIQVNAVTCLPVSCQQMLTLADIVTASVLGTCV